MYSGGCAGTIGAKGQVKERARKIDGNFAQHGNLDMCKSPSWKGRMPGKLQFESTTVDGMVLAQHVHYLEFYWKGKYGEGDDR